MRKNIFFDKYVFSSEVNFLIPINSGLFTEIEIKCEESIFKGSISNIQKSSYSRMSGTHHLDLTIVGLCYIKKNYRDS